MNYLLFTRFEDDSRSLSLNGRHAVQLVIDFTRLGPVYVGQSTSQSSGNHQRIGYTRLSFYRRVLTVRIDLEPINSSQGIELNPT